MKIDFHCHILPHMDDGSESMEMSLAMLRAEQEQGIERVILTPHFYRQQETVEAFLKRRNYVMKNLLHAASNKNLPELIVGAEVAMTNHLCYEPLKPLCIENTNTLLLEMPYAPMNHNQMQDLLALIDRNDVKIVLAHVERYRRLWGKKAWNKVMALPVYKQVNCGSLLSDNLFLRRCVCKWIASKQVHLLGSDAHNCTLRPVNWKRTLQYLQKKGYRTQVKKMMENAEQLSNPTSSVS